jgi:hypothetical protein
MGKKFLRQKRTAISVLSHVDGLAQHAERVYARTIQDQKGVTLRREHLAFLRGAKVVEDTGIAPQETRTETFTFDLSAGRRARVEADLFYFYSPMAVSEAEQKIRFIAMSRLVHEPGNG